MSDATIARPVPRRVLMTADTLGGVFGYALELARALAPHRVQVELATMGRAPSPAQRAEIARTPNVRLHESAWRLEWMQSPWDDVARAGEWLLALERAVRPDVVHLNGYAHAALPFAAPKLVVAHSCVAAWFHAVRGTRPEPAFDRYLSAVRAGLDAADLAVAISHATLAELRRDHGAFAAPARVVHNGRDEAAFPPGRKQPLVLAAGRLWDEAKNLRALDAAAKGLPWKVRLAGDLEGPDGALVRPAHAEALGPLSREELAAWMARASIYALPALYEPFGLAVVEAALAGCALVLGDVPSLRELWDGAAEFVPPRDARALHEALRRLVDDRERRDELAARARARARTYDVERFARGYLDAYGELLAARRPREPRETNACAS